MTLAEIIASVDEMNPNQFSAQQKTRWINEVEHKVVEEVINRSEGFLIIFRPYVYEVNAETVLKVPDQYADVYTSYLLAKIDFVNSDIERYNNAVAMHDAAFREYAAWFRRTHKPKRVHPHPCGKHQPPEVEALMDQIAAAVQELRVAEDELMSYAATTAELIEYIENNTHYDTKDKYIVAEGAKALYAELNAKIEEMRQTAVSEAETSVEASNAAVETISAKNDEVLAEARGALTEAGTALTVAISAVEQANAALAATQDAVSVKLDKSSVVNNLTTTAGGYALDARQGKALDTKIEAVDDRVDLANGRIDAVSGKITTISTGTATTTLATGTLASNVLRRVGRICTVEFYIYNTSTAASSTVLTIPSGF